MRKQLSALFILLGWTSAVLVCAIKPLAHCAPDSNAETSTHLVSDNYLHDAEPHQHGEEHPHDDRHQHDGDKEEAGRDSNCADDPSCKAIYSALNTTSPAVLVDELAARLLYELFQLSTIIRLDITVSNSAPSEERVLLLTHEVCTSVSSLPLAPPSA